MIRLVLLILVTLLPAWAQVKVTVHDDRISVDINGRPFTELFVKGEGVTKPYFHPLRSATGKIVTRRYPMEIVEGERQDHPHHRGLWFTHGDVNGLDFWTADPSREGDKYGMVELVEVGEVTSGEDRGSLTATFEWKDPRGKALVREERTVYFYAHPSLRIMDFQIRLTGVEKAKFGDTKEGTFAIRVAESMNERNGGTLVNAEGQTGEKNVWGKRSPWMDYYGRVDGEPLGVAIFDHPDNPKHPAYWHVRGYGLFAANIFGEHDFYADKTRDGSLTLEPYQSWLFQYRVVIHPGNAASAGLAKMYADYAK